MVVVQLQVFEMLTFLKCIPSPVYASHHRGATVEYNSDMSIFKYRTVMFFAHLPTCCVAETQAFANAPCTCILRHVK